MAPLKNLLALGFLAALLLPAGEAPKPKVRAITAFITIDAKSYPAQIEETVKFLNQVRDAVKAAGYDVAGIRISTQPFPDYTRGLSHDEALKVLQGIGDLAGKLHFAPNLGPAMVNDSDDIAPVALITEVLAKPGNRLNANIVTAGDDGIHWNAVRQAGLIIQGVGSRSPHGQGNFNFAAIAMLKPYGPFYPGAWHPGGGPRSFAIGLEAANVVMDVFSREHNPRTAAKALTAALSQHMHAVEAAAMKCVSGSGWTYAGIDPTPAPGGAVSIGTAIESFTGAPFGSPGTETAGRHYHSRCERCARKADRLLRAHDSSPRRHVADKTLDRGHVWPRFDSGVLGGLRGRCGYCSARRRHERSRHFGNRRRRRDSRLQVE